MESAGFWEQTTNFGDRSGKRPFFPEKGNMAGWNGEEKLVIFSAGESHSGSGLGSPREFDGVDLKSHARGTGQPREVDS